MGHIIKNYQYNYDKAEFEANLPPAHCTDNVIKRGLINYSIPEKVRLGLAPPEAMIYYERMKAEEAKAEEAKAEEEAKAASEENKPKKKNSTFWEDDTEERLQISDDEYQKFLSEHSIQVNNTQNSISEIFG